MKTDNIVRPEANTSVLERVHAKLKDRGPMIAQYETNILKIHQDNLSLVSFCAIVLQVQKQVKKEMCLS